MRSSRVTPRFIRAGDGLELAVHELGGEGRPLVILHATGFHARCYAPMVDTLGATRRCLGIDLRGHGSSQAPTGAGFGWDAIASDLVTVLGQLDLGYGEADVLGHSMGGCLSLLAAARLPGVWRAAWLFEPIVIPSGSAEARPNPMAEAARRRRSGFVNRQAALDRYSRRPPFSRTDRRFLEAYVDGGFIDQEDGSIALACRPEVEGAVFDGAHVDADLVLPDIDVPVTVVASGDGAPPSQIAPIVAGALPLGRLRRVDELDHFGPFSDPDLVAALVLEDLPPP